MKKAKIKERVAICLQQKRLCRFFFRYDVNYRYYFPLIVSEKLFLGIEEDDFILDGYAIRRLKDIQKVQIKEDMCEKILKAEGIIDSIITPDVDLSSWEMVFKSLQKRNKDIIVQGEIMNTYTCDANEFVIGRIEKVRSKYVYVRSFDADGQWQPEPHKIPYGEITSVIFAARYVDIFSKYLGELPENFGK